MTARHWLPRQEQDQTTQTLHNAIKKQKLKKQPFNTFYSRIFGYHFFSIFNSIQFNSIQNLVEIRF